jgi:hypothetical protein
MKLALLYIVALLASAFAMIFPATRRFWVGSEGAASPP